MKLFKEQGKMTFREVLALKGKLEHFRNAAGALQCRHLWNVVNLNISHIAPIQDKFWGSMKLHRDTIVYQQSVQRVKIECAVRDEKGNPVEVKNQNQNSLKEYEYETRIGDLLDEVDKEFKDVLAFNKTVEVETERKLDEICKDFTPILLEMEKFVDKDGVPFPDNAIMSLLNEIRPI